MRASDADRDAVAGILREAYVEGRLTPVEHEERLAETYRATTYGELVPVLRDLPVPPGTLVLSTPGVDLGQRVPAAAVEPGSATSLDVRPGAAVDSGTTLVAVFASFERKGPWTVPAQFSAVAIFGDGKLDFTEATLTANETVLTAVSLLGSLTITVPQGMAVRSEAAAILGDTSLPDDAAAVGAPILVIKGAAILGEIKVRRPKPPKKRRRLTGG